MGIAIGDYDNDGRDDVHITNFADDFNVLYHNHGRLDASRTSASRAGVAQPSMPFLGWGTDFLDYDNDGWLDLLVVNGHVYPAADRMDWNTSYAQRALLFRNLAGQRFEEVGAAAGAGLTRRAHVPRDSAVADIDNDGGLDMVINNIDAAPVLRAQRREPARGHWVDVRLRGDPAPSARRDAIGSVVFVTAGGRRMRGEVASGRGQMSQSDLTRALRAWRGDVDITLSKCVGRTVRRCAIRRLESTASSRSTRRAQCSHGNGVPDAPVYRSLPRDPGLRSEHDGEPGGLRLGAFERVVEAVPGQDLLHQRQADALAVRLGAEERGEQVRLRLGGDPRPRVLDRQRRRPGPRGHPDGDRSLAVDRLDRVLQDVEQRLLHLPAIDVDPNRRRSSSQRHVTRWPAGVALSSRTMPSSTATRSQGCRSGARQAEHVGKPAHEAAELLGPSR